MHMESMAINHIGAQEKGVDGRGAGGPAPTLASSTRLCDGVLRAFVAATALAAAVVMGMAKETATAEIEIVPTLPPLPVPVSAKWTYSSAFVYFVVANAIAAVHSLGSLFWSGLGARTRSSTSLTVAALDVAVVGLLFSANGAAMTFGLLGKYGNKHVGWTKVCGVFRSFCMHVEIAVAFSFLASLAYLVLALVSIVATHKKLSHLSAQVDR